MKRRLLSILLFPLVCSAFVLAQDRRNDPGPVPSDVLGPQLIAWSQLQQPQPVQQPDQPLSQANRQSEQVPSPQPAQPPAAQTLTGTIVKDFGRFILKVSSSTAYGLDDQARARKYEGKQVKIAGIFDAKGNSFHIIDIQLIS